jgi:hypothetical protein
LTYAKSLSFSFLRSDNKNPKKDAATTPSVEAMAVDEPSVTTRKKKNPNIRIVCYFIFLHHRDVMHHHASLTLHVLQNLKIIWCKTISYFRLYGSIKTLSFFSCLK